jgi:hypothetical protein
MSGGARAYAVEKLAPGSYDVLLGGVLIAALTRDIDGPVDEWRIDLLAETSPSERPPPFEGQSHTFSSYRAALNWLGIHEDAAVRRLPSARRSKRATPRYRTHPSPSDRYRLRLLSEHSRFYATTVGLGGLISRGYIAPTGQTDDEGRAKWVITDAGRSALTELEL